LTPDPEDYRARANAEAAAPFVRDTLMPRFARALSGWLDCDDPLEHCHAVHAELGTLRLMLREYAQGMDAAEGVVTYEGGL
jgi:hypothetical protein